MQEKLNRRACLRRLAAGAGGIAVGVAALRRQAAWAQVTAATASARATAEVLLDEPIRDASGQPAVINPNLHGHFVEHIGGVVYDGIWVGPESPIPNIDGIRRSIVESLRKLRPPIMRWPGGCFADRYHWRDGIGPRESRPRRFGRWNEVTESNHFGTHEFMQFCRLTGAEPYFCANVGTGTAEQFQQWVEYCNAPAGRLSVGDERVANGHPEPFGVRYWAVGNENWGCGGSFTPEDYCTEYRRFVTWLPSFGVPCVLIGCGPSGNDLDWTRRFLKKWRDGASTPMHAWAAHYYCGTSGTATEFNTDQWYDLLDRANRMEKLVVDQWGAMGEFDPRHEVKLIIDEWGTWHPADARLRPEFQFAQYSTMRDALVAALTLDTFHRHADKVVMGNIAQLVNCLQSLYMTDGDRMVETTIYHVFAMYQAHHQGIAVPLRLETPTCSFSREGGQAELFRVAGSASRREREVTVTLVHTHHHEPIEIDLRLREGRVAEVSGTVLAHERLNALNDFDHPRAVVPRPLAVPAPQADGRLVLTVPPAAVVGLQLTLA